SILRLLLVTFDSVVPVELHDELYQSRTERPCSIEHIGFKAFLREMVYPEHLVRGGSTGSRLPAQFTPSSPVLLAPGVRILKTLHFQRRAHTKPASRKTGLSRRSPA